MTLYAAAVRLYPRTFREEYGVDLLAVADDLRVDLGWSRAAVRLAGDLLVSVPAQHLEVLMKRPAPLLVPVLGTACAAALVGLAAVVGTAAGVVMLALAALSALVAGLAFPSSRVVRDRALTARWWQLLVLGALLNSAVAGGQALFDSDSSLVWPLAFLGVVGGWLCLGAGVVLAILHVSRRRTPA